jgi:hypothetical protein
VEGVLANSMSNITVNKVVFDQNQLGVAFRFVDSSTIQNCTFMNIIVSGIEDFQSIGGNSYNNSIFVGSGRALYVQSDYNGTPLVLDRCDFAAPPSN